MTQPIALVVSDVDGTLTNPAGIVSPANQREIRRVMSRGIHFSIATGRPTRDLQKVRESLDLALPVIVSNGTMVEDLATGEIIHSLQIERSVILTVLDVIAKHDVDAVILDTPQGWIYQVRNAAGEPPPWIISVGDTAHRIEEWNSYLAEERTVLKILVEGAEADLQRVEHALATVPGVQITASFANNREIFVAHAGKANAARLLATRLGIDPSQVLAIGDQRNDIELIRWAGIGVAMGNAVPELKAVADWVTRSNDEDGVAHALAHFIPDPLLASDA
ncbi:MAG: HAD family hydrolase [Chloroflexota bacterium]|nr:HAD family hydrolase [Chloroflexota bacterium]